MRRRILKESVLGYEKMLGRLGILLVIANFMLPFATEACTRFTYTGIKDDVITARSWDWLNDRHTDLWAYPAGISRSGNSDDKNSARWVSKYGSVTTSAFNIATADGMNTAGLDVNILYLYGSEYAKPVSGANNLTLFTWGQFMLDNYATVNEAVNDFGSGKYNMLAVPDLDGAKMHLHMAISDASGDNAVFEYINGKLVVHHGKQYNVMTNEPSFDQQLALNAYWQRLDGKFLPGTEDPTDRFVRTSYYLKNALKTNDYQQEIATVFSIIRNASTPFGEAEHNRPNLAPTYWRSVADLKNKIYYFEEANRPNVFWVELDKLDLRSGAAIKKLPLAKGELYSGEVSSNFVPAQAFIAPQITPAK